MVSPALCTGIPRDDGASVLERNTDYALNALYVLGFIASGDGGTEAARFLGFTGLPNSTTMHSRLFPGIEKEISPVLEDLALKTLHKNLKEEVKIVLGDKTEDDGNKLFDLWLEKKLSPNQHPKTDGSADMGWQQRGSGRKRNSSSGHALIIASNARNPVAKALCSKGCGFCMYWYTTHPANKNPPDHDCVINHEGSSGSMEPVAVLRMHIWLHTEKHVIVDRFIADDDSSIKAKLKWNNEDHMAINNTTVYPTIVTPSGNVTPRPDIGGAPKEIPEPSFIADPNHRRKTLTGELYALEGKKKTSPREQL